MTYTEMRANYLYLESIQEQQVSFRSYIGECLILAESENVVSRLKAFNEAEKRSAWQKIKDMFKKFGEFIKHIFSKFFSTIQRFTNNKNWLANNKEIILNRPVKITDVKMHNYPLGIERISKTTIPKFDYENIKDKLVDNVTAEKWMAEQIGCTDYAQKTSAIFSEEMKNFFLGGEVLQVYAGKDLNMTNIYNYCYEYENMTNILNRDKSILDAAIQAGIDLADKYSKEEPPAEDNTTAAQEPDDTRQVEQNISSNNNDNGDKTESVVFSRVYNQYITEADDKIQINTTNAKANDDSTIVKGTAADAVKNNQQNAETLKKDINSAVDGVNTAGDDRNERLTAVQTHCEKYRDVATSVITAKLEAAEKAYKEYMKILIAHVNMYKGYSKKDSKPTQNPTNYNAKDDTSSVANAQKSIIADLTDNGNNTTIGKTENDVVAAFKQAINSGKYTNGLSKDDITVLTTNLNKVASNYASKK